mgnify:CR=1 FL=1
MIGPVTDLFEVPAYQAVDWYLPATAHEIAARMERPVKWVQGHLRTLKTKGWAKPVPRKVPNGNEGLGAHRSPLWVRV